MDGSKAMGAAIERLEKSPSNELASESCQIEKAMGWDGQWLNWDHLGPGDPGWGDVGD